MSGILDAIGNLDELKDKVEDIVGSFTGNKDEAEGEESGGLLGGLGDLAEKFGLDGLAEKLGGLDNLDDKLDGVKELADKFGGVDGIKAKIDEMGGLDNVLGSLGSLFGGKKEE